MGFCWSSWIDEDFSFGIFPKFQDRNVEWCRCTRVVLVLLWSIYFFWVFGVLLYSDLVDDLEFQDAISNKSSFNQGGWEEYDGRAEWPNHPLIVGSLCCNGLFLLFNRDLIWKENCGDSDKQVSVLRRKETHYDQGVGNKVSSKDGASHAQKYLNLKSKSFFSSTTMVQLVSFITNQKALELVLVAGSLSYCYNLTFGSIRKTVDWDIKRFGISKFLVSNKCHERNIAVELASLVDIHNMWYGLDHKSFRMALVGKLNRKRRVMKGVTTSSFDVEVLSCRVYNNLNLSTFNVRLAIFITCSIALELAFQVGSHSMCYEVVFELAKKTLVDDDNRKERAMVMEISSLQDPKLRSSFIYSFYVFKYVSLISSYVQTPSQGVGGFCQRRNWELVSILIKLLYTQIIGIFYSLNLSDFYFIV